VKDTKSKNLNTSTASPSGLFGSKEVVEFLVPDFPISLPFPGEEAEAEHERSGMAWC